MIFNSFSFVAFFLVVYSLYLVLALRWQNRMLLVASYVFYGWWDWRFLGLIALSTVVDYAAGRGMTRTSDSTQRRRYLLVSICTNLGILGIFKYTNFFVQSLSDALAVFGYEIDARMASIVLPVGISFYTFQTMSYTIDVYRGRITAADNFFDFALFVAFFPQLVAGPIERARVLLPQLTAPRKMLPERFEEGCWLILSGYYLKCVLADNLAPFVERVFQTPESVSGFEIVIGVWAAAFQIYGDFAGYSRIAIGVAKLMGIDLMTNFRRPYFAFTPSDFWTRWHISLSSWLRDYLYIPLGGNRGSSIATYRNLMLTMLLGGLWHGAAWNFVAWGFFQGGVLCIWRFASGTRSELKLQVTDSNNSLHFLRVLGFFQLTCFGWLLFFAKDLADVPLLIVNCLSKWQWNGTVGLTTLIMFSGPVIMLELFGELKNCNHIVFEWSRPLRLVAYGCTAFVIVLCGVAESREFIYFQF